jgi:hypothetical protein
MRVTCWAHGMITKDGKSLMIIAAGGRMGGLLAQAAMVARWSRYRSRGGAGIAGEPIYGGCERGG